MKCWEGISQNIRGRGGGKVNGAGEVSSLSIGRITGPLEEGVARVLDVGERLAAAQAVMR